MSSEVTSTWAGSPSRIATRDGPWDSPAVSQRSMRAVCHGTQSPGSPAPDSEMPCEVGAPHDADHYSHEHERSKRDHQGASESQAPDQNTSPRADTEPHGGAHRLPRRSKAGPHKAQ